MTEIDVQCRPEDDGWQCQVALDDDPQATYSVGVPRKDLAALDPSAQEPTDLVRRSFAFLLERESKDSILRSFDLMVIGRYFPEYETTISKSA